MSSSCVVDALVALSIISEVYVCIHTEVSHCLSSTVISDSVLRYHIGHLQLQNVLAIVSGDVEFILQGQYTVCGTAIFTNFSNPLQTLSQSLSNAMHPLVSKSKPRGYIRES